MLRENKVRKGQDAELELKVEWKRRRPLCKGVKAVGGQRADTREKRTRTVDAEVPSWAVPGEFKGQQEMSQREEEADC